MTDKKKRSLVSLDASVSGTTVGGRITLMGDRYEVLIDDRMLGVAADLKACLRTLGLFLRAALPAVDEGDWELDVRCRRSQRFGISMGSMGIVGPMTWVGSEETPCIEKILNAMPLHTLSDAIEAALAAIAACCLTTVELGITSEDLADGGLRVGRPAGDP